jgi:hypothetical protein
MLRSSAETTGRDVEIVAISDPNIDPLLDGGRALASLGRLGSTITTPDTSGADAVAAELGEQAAADAAAIAAAFEGLNRIVDGVGLPVGRAARRDLADIIDALGLNAFPHSSHGA